MRQQSFHRVRNEPIQLSPSKPAEPSIHTLKGKQPTSLVDREFTGAEDPATTVFYLRSYLNQVVLENRQLKHLVEQQAQQISFLEELLNQRFYELEALRKSKQEIDRAVYHVTNINNSYLEQLNRRGRQVEELKQRIAMSGPSSCSLQFGRSSNGDYQKLMGKYIRLEAKYNALKEKVVGESQLGTSTTSAGCLLDEVKNYVRDIQNRGKLFQQGISSMRVH